MKKLIAGFCLFTLLAVASVALAALPKKRISLDVKDADIHNVLRLVADAARVNVVVSEEVRGRVTIKLTNVPWSRALAVILASRGLGMERSGNVIFVDTLERMTRRAELDLERARVKRASERLVTAMIPVSYARAAELVPIVRGLLSDRGTVSVDARTNTLIVTDVADNTQSVEALFGAE